MSVEVKWLYPGADQERLQGEVLVLLLFLILLITILLLLILPHLQTSDQEMESELQTDQSVQGSSRNDTEGGSTQVGVHIMDSV